jgi:prepilin peptidase CpaA
MHSLAWWPTVVMVTVATITDLRSRRIPNWLVFPFMALGLVVALWAHSWHGLGQSLEGFGLGVLVYGLLFMLGGMGMGDVKLMSAVGIWVGPVQLVWAMIITGLVGGLMALFVGIAGGYLKDSLKGIVRLIFGWKKNGLRPHPEFSLDHPGAHKMAYAPAIAIGTLLSFFAH